MRPSQQIHLTGYMQQRIFVVQLRGTQTPRQATVSPDALPPLAQMKRDQRLRREHCGTCSMAWTVAALWPSTKQSLVDTLAPGTGVPATRSTQARITEDVRRWVWEFSLRLNATVRVRGLEQHMCAQNLRDSGMWGPTCCAELLCRGLIPSCQTHHDGFQMLGSWTAVFAYVGNKSVSWQADHSTWRRCDGLAGRRRQERGRRRGRRVVSVIIGGPLKDASRRGSCGDERRLS